MDGNISDKAEITRGDEEGNDVGGGISAQHLIGEKVNRNEGKVRARGR